MGPDVEQRYCVMRDGTRIGYQVSGRGPVVVLANGLGGTYLSFLHIYRALPQHRVLCWDYRGLYSSAAPSDPTAQTIAHQVDDLLEILAQEGVGEFALVGWSMGVQVALETVRAARARVRGLLLLNGTAGEAFRTLGGGRVPLGQAMVPLLRVMRAQSGLLGAMTRMVADKSALVQVLIGLGMVAPTVDREVFRQVAAGFTTIDWKIYADLIARIDEHNAAPILPTISVPTEIVTGSRDRLTPPATARAMRDAIEGAALTEVRGGTHYTPVEFPEAVQAVVARWLTRMPGYAAADAAGHRAEGIHA